MPSGYKDCACRDCFDIAIGEDGEAALCNLCAEAGCEPNNGECERTDAYGADDEGEGAKMSTRYQTTEYNRAERMVSRMRDIYSSAQIFHMTHRQLLDTMTEKVYSTQDYRKLKPYYRGYLAGVQRILAYNLYRYHLEWRVRLDGKLVKSEEVPKGEWSRVQMGEHVWKDAPDKLFSTPKEGD
jgi:hypothetical protein